MKDRFFDASRRSDVKKVSLGIWQIVFNDGSILDFNVVTSMNDARRHAGLEYTEILNLDTVEDDSARAYLRSRVRYRVEA